MNRSIGLLVFCCFLLSACMSPVFTGANLIYDRHHVYIKMNDLQLGADVHRALYHDRVFKCDECAIDIAVFHRDVLLVGHVPSLELRTVATQRIRSLKNKRQLFNQLHVQSMASNPFLDVWITFKLRMDILMNANIDPQAFKIMTCDGIVYLMGEVMPEQGAFVLRDAQGIYGVKRVVNLLKYFQWRPSKEPDPVVEPLVHNFENLAGPA